MMETSQRNGVADVMKNHQRISVIVVLAALGTGSAVNAQTASGFGRVTTITRNGGTAAQSSRAARVGAARVASRTSLQSDALRPYRARALSQAQAQKSQGPRTSSWQQEPAPVMASPQPPAPAGSHNYYPTLRPGLALQQPVTFTAHAGFLPIQACTGGGLASAVGGRHR